MAATGTAISVQVAVFRRGRTWRASVWIQGKPDHCSALVIEPGASPADAIAAAHRLYEPLFGDAMVVRMRGNTPFMLSEAG